MLNFAYLTSFQKSYIGWPQQPPTVKILKFNLKFHDSTQKNFFSKNENEAELLCMDYSEVLNSDFSGPKTTAASMTSVTSTASMTSTASYHQKTY
jgi:hypothetical protein